MPLAPPSPGFSMNVKDVSHAGLRSGLMGQSSGLVLHVFRLLDRAIKDNRPVPWVLLENVPGLLDCNPAAGPAIAQIVSTFERLGYHSWAHRVITSAAFGLPNRRRRVFVLASMYGDARDVLLSTGRTNCLGSCIELYEKACYSCHMSKLEKISGRSHVDCNSDEDEIDFHFDHKKPSYLSTKGDLAAVLPKTSGEKNTEITSEVVVGDSHKDSTPVAPEDGSFQVGRGALECMPFTTETDGELHDSLGVSQSLKEETDEEEFDGGWSYALDLGNARSPGAVDMVPTFTTNTSRICLLLSNNKMGMLRIEDAERLQGFPEGYTECCYPVAAPGAPIHRALNAVERSGSSTTGRREGERWKLLGNAVTVQIGEWLGKQLLEPYKYKYVPSSEDLRFDTISCDGGGGLAEYFDDELHSRSSLVVPGTWPRGAWYLKTLGRHVATVSEAPEIHPFTPLGQFVSGVGQPPDPGSLSIYVGRMREQGWDVTQTIEKAMRCGAASFLPSELEALESQVTPLRIGKLCWAKLPKWPWWPGEILDPSDEKPPRPIPPSALQHCPQTNLAIGDRYVLVIFFGDNTYHWMQESQLRDFIGEAEEKTEEGVQATLYNRILGTLFRTSVKHAWEAHRQSLGETTLGDQLAFRASRAAADAVAAGRGERCGACQTCQEGKASGHNHRKCLVRRAHAAAAAGHAGAQLAVLGEDCIGARVLVWWPLDSEWYAGVVSSHDPMLMKHKVEYDDGDIETISLWSASQTMRVLTPASEWAKTKEILEQKKKDMLALAQQSLPAEEKEPLESEKDLLPSNDFEKERLENIQRNKEAFLSAFKPTPCTETNHEGEEDRDAGDTLTYHERSSTPIDPPTKVHVRLPSWCCACGEPAGRSKARVASCPICNKQLIHLRCLHPAESHHFQRSNEWKCTSCLTKQDFLEGRFCDTDLTHQDLMEFHMARKCEAELRMASLSKRRPVDASRGKSDLPNDDEAPKRQKKTSRGNTPLVVQAPKFFGSV